MQATDCRNATFAGIERRLSGLRALVYAELVNHGPCTSKGLALVTGMGLDTIRPRMCELLQLGLARLEQRATLRDLKGREGVYAAVPLAELRAELEERRANRAQQLEMRIPA